MFPRSSSISSTGRNKADEASKSFAVTESRVLDESSQVPEKSNSKSTMLTEKTVLTVSSLYCANDVGTLTNTMKKSSSNENAMCTVIPNLDMQNSQKTNGGVCNAGKDYSVPLQDTSATIPVSNTSSAVAKAKHNVCIYLM